MCVCVLRGWEKTMCAVQLYIIGIRVNMSFSNVFHVPSINIDGLEII